MEIHKKIAEFVKKHWLWTTIYSATFVIFAIDIYFALNSGIEDGDVEGKIVLWTLVFFAILFVQLFTTSIPLPPLESLPSKERAEQAQENEGTKSAQRRRWMIFSYSFMLVSLLGGIVLFSVGWNNSVAKAFRNPETPLAVFVGCSKDNNKDVPNDVRCVVADLDDKNLQVSKGTWVLNIGGYVTNFKKGNNEQKKTDNQHDKSDDQQISQCENGVCEISGGLIVPLYVIVIALMGGSISLTRRLPEYQVQATVGYVSTESKPKLNQHQFREYLIFQMVQFLSAPLLAVLAYYLVDPSNTLQTVALSFTAGFASETILVMIRGVSDKLKPSLDTGTKVGSITGVVTLDSKVAKKVDVFVAASPNLKTLTDEYGHYVIGNIPIGEHAINYIVPLEEPNQPLKKTETIKIDKPQTIVTKNIKFATP